MGQKAMQFMGIFYYIAIKSIFGYFWCLCINGLDVRPGDMTINS